MNSGKIVFSQLMHIVPRYEFHKCVQRYQGNRRVRDFSCWNQFLAMALENWGHIPLFGPPLRSPTGFSDQASFQFRLYPPHKTFVTKRCPPPGVMSQTFSHPREKHLIEEADIVFSLLRGKDLLSQYGVSLPGHMGFGAGVGILFRSLCHAGTNRILLDVSYGRPQVPFLLHNTRMIAALPQPPRSPILSVNVLGVTQGQSLHHLVQRGLRGGSGQKVHMIVHETIGQHRRIPFLRIVLEERKVPPSILPVEEHLLPVIPPLDDMMGESRRNGSGNPRHGRRLALHRVIVKKMGCVPNLLSLP